MRELCTCAATQGGQSCRQLCAAQHVCWELLQFGPSASGVNTLNHLAISQAPYFYFNLKVYFYLCVCGAYNSVSVASFYFKNIFLNLAAHRFHWYSNPKERSLACILLFHDLGTDLQKYLFFFFWKIQILASEVKVWSLHLIWKRRVLATRLLLLIALLCFCCMVHSSLYLWASLNMGIWGGKAISLFLRARLK